MNGEKRIRAIVFAGKKLPQLEFFQLVNETRVFADAVPFPPARVAAGSASSAASCCSASKSSVVPLEFRERIQERTQPRNLLDIGLGAFAIRPEIRRAHALFERS